MDGRAIIWWNRLYSLNKCPNDWANFKELLNSEFKPLFAILKQGTSSVQDYGHAMQDILLETTDIAEPEAIDHFVRNLKPALFAKVRGARPGSLDAAFKAAFDEEICLLPPGISPTALTSSFLPSSVLSHAIDDPMDLSVLKHSMVCE